MDALDYENRPPKMQIIPGATWRRLLGALTHKKQQY